MKGTEYEGYDEKINEIVKYLDASAKISNYYSIISHLQFFRTIIFSIAYECKDDYALISEKILETKLSDCLEVIRKNVQNDSTDSNLVSKMYDRLWLDALFQNFQERREKEEKPSLVLDEKGIATHLHVSISSKRSIHFLLSTVSDG